MNKWISIKEKLPKRLQLVLMYIPAMQTYTMGDAMFVAHFCEELLYDYKKYDDIYWMPVPELKDSKG